MLAPNLKSTIDVPIILLNRAVEGLWTEITQMKMPPVLYVENVPQRQSSPFPQELRRLDNPPREYETAL
jgi:hypothetical protein